MTATIRTADELPTFLMPMAKSIDEGEMRLADDPGAVGIPRAGIGPPEVPPKQGRRTAERLTCVAGLVVALVLLAAGQLAWLWIAFDIVNHFTIHLVVMAVACLSALIMPRRGVPTALAGMVIGVIGIGLWPHYVSHDAPAPLRAASGQQTVRVMTFNTSLFNTDWRAVADEILRQDPDIVALIEIGREKAPLFEALAAKYPHRVDCIGEANCHLAILSKHSFAASEVRTGWRGPAFARAEYGAELNRLMVTAVHTLRPPHFAAQLSQMTALGDELAGQDRPQMVLGDLNSTPFSRMLKTLVDRSGLLRASGLPSWPATLSLPQIAIDHILISPLMSPAGKLRIGNSAGSDHYPLIVEVAIPPG